MSHVAGIVGYILTVIVVAVFVILVRSVLLLFRVADRSSRALSRTLASASRGLFGPGGSPEEIARHLRERYPELSRGKGSGLAFSCMGCPGRLDFITDLTEIRFDLRDRSADHVEVSTPSFMTRIAEDDPDAFRVRGDQDLYRRIFRDPALGTMLRGWDVPFEWIVRPGEFFLQLRALPLNEEELWRWLKGAFRLLESLPGIGGETKLPVTRVSPATLAESICQICGTNLGQGAVVYCVRCATPHHEECWTYAGQCSTFACTERSYAR